MRCPRCRGEAGHDGTFCPHCGRHLALLHWVAEPPPSARQPAAALPRPPYSGPPRYRQIPRWGFAPSPWRPAWSHESDASESPALRAVRTAHAALVPMLVATAAVAVLAAFAEVMRYVLLLFSRDGALSAGTVVLSDALVNAAGWVAPAFGALAGVMLVRWCVQAAAAAAEQAGVRPARTARSIVLGWLVPGLNLAVPGSTLAEIEHAAFRRPAAQRPRPSGLLLCWWGLWGAGVLLSGLVLAWSLRTGVQARADGVLLHALLDLLAAATALVTARLVGRITRMIGPMQPGTREVLIAVRG